ncbi:type II toxin-antitoxin system PemK/MazF family toxin [Candidatus Symbiothrix dinenymphae]|uniref:type II toxin-antitoxin system PemK/MazF family toxin n=1 Tax=Candidatus Symbiothrix dinenymphae TaxID=467085 RepID=UPI0006C0C742|nr:type II toxin-antitoxin system PemK/MazF family toxin [Candidatus Symbiothrix dinenymphae]GAP72788.1 transcriptional modulator of MazE/toxin MazF [Candidatus Symbiothrix dinenymphae]
MIKRGEIWTVRWTGLVSKPRSALVIQSEKYLQTSTGILALITSENAPFPDVRLLVAADEYNGLLHDSYICLDKLMAIPLTNIDKRLGLVSPEILHEIDMKLTKILGIEQ